MWSPLRRFLSPPHSLRSLLTVSACAIVGCSTPESPRLGLVINEVLTHPLQHPGAGQKYAGTWVEIVNDNSRAQSLSGFGLSDDRTVPFKWTFPEQTLGPGASLVLSNLPFELRATGQELVLTSPNGTTQDAVVVPVAPPNISYGRVGTHNTQWGFLQHPTPEEANTKLGWSPTPPTSTCDVLCITEVMAENKQYLLDEDGDASDWFELHNASEKAISTKGMYLSDSGKELKQWALPEIELAPKSYTLIFASGKNRSAPQWHTNFKLKPEKDVLLLTHETEGPIDSVPLPKLGKNVSLGRVPEAINTWLVYTKATPGAQIRVRDALRTKPLPQPYRLACALMRLWPLTPRSHGMSFGNIQTGLNCIIQQRHPSLLMDMAYPTMPRTHSGSPFQIWHSHHTHTPLFG